MDKIYMVGSGATDSMLAEARMLAEKQGKELVVVECEEDLPKPITLPYYARPEIPDIFIEPVGGYDNRTSRKNKGKNKKYLY